MKKIAIIGKNDVDSLAWHIEYTLNKMNFEAKTFEPTGGIESKLLNKNIQFYLTKLFTKYEDYIYQSLITQIVDYKADLTIVILRSIPPYVIKSLKEKLATKVIFWTGDGLVNLERQYALVSAYDAFFVKDTYMENFMKNKLDLNVYLMPECVNPYVQHKPSDVIFGSQYNVSVVGTLYPYRAKILEQLIENGIKVNIFGAIPRWIGSAWEKRHAHKYVVLNDKNEVFYGSKINLNTIFYGDIDAGNCRLFEVAGSGGFQICDRKKEIENYFEEDKEIVFFDTTDELIEKIEYYLNHQDEAEQIAKNAYQRAINEHTYEHRIKKIFEIIGFEY